MNVIDTQIPDIKEIVPQVFRDERGYFFESFNAHKFAEKVAAGFTFVQDNHSQSKHAVVRGLHYQIQNAQGKLVRVVEGEVFDAVVDMRKSSRTFGKAAWVTLSATRNNLLWVPPGFAHGFMVISPAAQFLYKTTDYWSPQYERTLLWNDPALNIPWPISTLGSAPIVNAKDQAGAAFCDAETYA